MTKKELLVMLENIDDNAELFFVGQDIDRDGYPYDIQSYPYKVLDKEKVKRVRHEYGIYRYE